MFVVIGVLSVEMILDMIIKVLHILDTNYSGEWEAWDMI